MNHLKQIIIIIINSTDSLQLRMAQEWVIFFTSDLKVRAIVRIEFLLGSSVVENFGFNSLYNKSQIYDTTPRQQHIYRNNNIKSYKTSNINSMVTINYTK